MPDETSSTLLLSARDRGDHAAWTRLVRIYSPLLYAWVRRAGVTGPDIDDIVQEVLLAVAREMPSFRYDSSRGSFRGWLRTTLLNRVRHHRRGGIPTAGGVGLDAVEAHDDLRRIWDEEHDRHVVSGLLDAVRHEFGEKVWAAFTRVVMDGESPAEVAAALNTSVDAVYQSRSRVLARLRREAEGLLD